MSIAYSTVKEVRDIVALLMQRPITEKIAMAVKSVDGFKHLLVVDGQWTGFYADRDEMTTGEEHGWTEFRLLLMLGNHVVSKNLGRLYPGDVTFVLDGTPGDIRKMVEPDVAFVATENVKPSKGFIYRAPDLAIEIKSPSQSDDEMRDKAAEYLQYGTKQVWLVLPDKKQIEVHIPNTLPKIYGVGDVIHGGDLLSGFVLDVMTIFAEA